MGDGRPGPKGRTERLVGRAAAAVVLAGTVLFGCRMGSPGGAELRFDEAGGRMTVLLSGRETVTYRYGQSLDLAHYGPLRGPSGRDLLVERTEPYPHHRSFWFADTVQIEGSEGEISFYNAYTSGVLAEDGAYGPPFRDRVRHRRFTRLGASGRRAEVEADLVWETAGRPVLDELRRLVVHDLGQGEYLLDVTWTLAPSSGEVRFVSDDVHYAWPYLRMAPELSGERGGTILSDTGAKGQEATNMRPARWIDYSTPPEGPVEGVAVFQWPDGEEHRWLTREYGTFGPRRPDRMSGRPFVLRPGEAISQRIGVLVHRGDARSGRVAERFEDYIKGRWK